MSSQVTPAERLLDLVIALTHTTHRMTRAQIRSSVHGYSEAASPEAFERMFERDKETLRELGVPLVTDVDGAHGDDVGYRIDVDGYEMPPIELTAEEIGVLSVAAQVWQDARLDARARRGLTKLRAIAPQAQEVLSGHVLRMPAPEEHFDVLMDAIGQRRVATFDYAAAHSGRTTRREVEPWRLIARDGAWYLQAHDRQREAERLFRLSRIEGHVRVLAPGSATHPIGAPTAPEPPGLATLRVQTGRAGSLRLRAVAPPAGEQSTTTAQGHDGEGWDLLYVPIRDLPELAGLIARHTDAVVVLDPPPLRTAVLARLRAVAALDGAHA